MFEKPSIEIQTQNDPLDKISRAHQSPSEIEQLQARVQELEKKLSEESKRRENAELSLRMAEIAVVEANRLRQIMEVGFRQQMEALQNQINYLQGNLIGAQAQMYAHNSKGVFNLFSPRMQSSSLSTQSPSQVSDPKLDPFDATKL
jgi:chromosome segregation ATPase